MVMDLVRELRDCSFLIWAFLEDYDYCIWNALSFLVMAMGHLLGGEVKAGEGKVRDKKVAIHCLNWKVKKKECSIFNLGVFVLSFKV